MEQLSRRRTPEWMDEPGLDVGLHRDALVGLSRLNRASLTAACLWRPIRAYARQQSRSRLTVLDVASGGGDVMLSLARRSAASGVDLDILGCDISATAVSHANQAAANQQHRVRFERLDVLTDTPIENYDIVTSTLFLHHLSNEDALGLLRRMSSFTTGLLLVNDLLRSRTAWLIASVACRTLTRSPVVRVDGPSSVASAYSIAEVEELCQAAPLPHAKLTQVWPWRFLLEWSPNDAI